MHVMTTLDRVDLGVKKGVCGGSAPRQVRPWRKEEGVWTDWSEMRNTTYVGMILPHNRNVQESATCENGLYITSCTIKLANIKARHPRIASTVTNVSLQAEKYHFIIA